MVGQLLLNKNKMLQCAAVRYSVKTLNLHCRIRATKHGLKKLRLVVSNQTVQLIFLSIFSTPYMYQTFDVMG
jgi:hypothetical protein